MRGVSAQSGTQLLCFVVVTRIPLGFAIVWIERVKGAAPSDYFTHRSHPPTINPTPAHTIARLSAP